MARAALRRGVAVDDGSVWGIYCYYAVPPRRGRGRPDDHAEKRNSPEGGMGASGSLLGRRRRHRPLPFLHPVLVPQVQ
jgi:hypothetical protein